MLQFFISFLVVIFCVFNEIECLKTIQDLLPGYYDGETVQQFTQDWKKYQHAFDNAIESGLQEDFGTPAVNIYEKNRQNRHVLGSGFTITDGVVRVYFYELVLRQIPSLLRPRLNLNLPYNYGKFESRLDRVFIDTTYYVARNRSAEVYAGPEEQKDMSPFSLQQVDRLGNVTIIADNCLLSGISILTLIADSVNLGHTTVQVTDCKFMVEISTPNSGAPPVIAPYFAQDAKEKMELMMSKPIREELQTKLQGALYSYVNTSVLFGSKKVHKFRKNQRQLFNSYAKFMVDYVSNLNKNTLKANKGTTTMKGFNVVTDVAPKESSSCHLILKDLKLHGLETAYAARSGGPFKDDSSTSATEAIIFSSMQIHGTGVHEDDSGKKENTVAAEIRDVAVSLTISIEKSKTKVVNLQLMGWRSFEFSINGWCLNPHERIGYQTLYYGHVLNELPVRIINHLTSILGALPNGGELPNNDESSNADELISDGNKKATENEEMSEEKTDKGNDNEYASSHNSENGKKKGFFSDVGTFFSDGLKENFLSDKMEGNIFSDKVEANFFSDKVEDKFLSGKVDDKFFSDDVKEKFYSDKVENVSSDKKGKSDSNSEDEDDAQSGGSGNDKKTSNDENGSDTNGKQDDTNKGKTETDENKNDGASGDDDHDVGKGSDDDENQDGTDKGKTETDGNKNGGSSENDNNGVEKGSAKENFFSDNMKENLFSDNMQKNFFSDKTDGTFFSDKEEGKFFSDKKEGNFFSDKEEGKFFSDNEEGQFFSDKEDEKKFSDKRDKGDFNLEDKDDAQSGGSGNDKKTSNGKDGSKDENGSDTIGKQDDTNKGKTETDKNKNDGASGDDDHDVENASDDDGKQDGNGNAGNDKNEEIKNSNSGNDDNINNMQNFANIKKRRIAANDENIPKRKSGNKKGVNKIKRNDNDDRSRKNYSREHTPLKHANKKEADRRNVDAKLDKSKNGFHLNVHNARRFSNPHMSENEVH